MDWRVVAELLATALGAIDKVVATVRNKNDKLEAAANALTVVTAILEAVKGGKLEDLDPETARAELAELIATLQISDDAADAAVAAKFGD